MNLLFTVSLVFLLLCFFITITASTDDKPFHPPDEVSINCGSIRISSAARNGRQWQGDGHKSFSLLKLKGSSTTSYAIHQKLVSDPVPYQTARISRSQFSYQIQINPGQKILRFHFNAAPYNGFKQYRDLFDVEAGPFTLLGNFSATLAADALGVSSIIKEFCMDIKENNQMLNVTFTPTSSQFRDTYGFINGIEILSVPASQSYFHMEDAGVQLIGKSLVTIDSSRVIEIMQRLSSKQELVSLPTDSERFQSRGNVAEQGGKQANNITWKIPVDVGFRYVVRLHFSRLGFRIAEIGGFMFQVLINGWVSTTNSDAFAEREEDGRDWYRDYSVVMTGSKLVGRRDLLISMLSNVEFLDGHGPLKGFEILKLSNPHNSLASPNPLHSANPPFHQTPHILHRVLGRKNAIVNCAILVLVLLNISLYILWMIQEANRVEDDYFRHGVLKSGRAAAIKVLRHSTKSDQKFLEEVSIISSLKHENLAELLGYSMDGDRRILVYEYASNGSLHDILHGSGRVLSWSQRVKIAVDAAKGLEYLHEKGHTHGHFKSSNILVFNDSKVAKITDFHIPSPCPAKVQEEDSFFDNPLFSLRDSGYILRKDKPGAKTSDVYSFGVVLLELLTGRKAFDDKAPMDQKYLVIWARKYLSEDRVKECVDGRLNGEYSREGVAKMAEVADSCLDYGDIFRPSMNEIVKALSSIR